MKKLYVNSLCLGLLLYCSSSSLLAQDSLSAHLLIRQIEDQQTRHDAFFMDGIFPSYISKRRAYEDKKKDNNVFYTALILYTLKKLRPMLPLADQVIVDSIAARSGKLFTQFKNNKGRETYNFWRTDSAYRFPFIWWLPLNKKHILADDPDCTSMCLLALDATNSIAQKAHMVMQNFSNDRKRPTVTAPSRYRYFSAYSGWFWKGQPAVFDICVISNILTLVQTYDLPWTKADSASMTLLLAIVNDKEYITDPVMVSPYYGSTSIILYHLARLMSIKSIPALEATKPMLITEALRQLQQTKDELEKIILNTALLKWNSKVAPELTKRSEIGKSNLPFIIANIPSFFPFLVRKTLTNKGIGLYYYYCPSYNNVLLLENLVLTKNEIK